MVPLLEFVFRSFWTFIGFFILITVILEGFLNFVLQIIHKNIRANTIRKVGYPPDHCDGDGDFKKEKENDES